MKATLIVIQNEADFIEARALVEALMTSEDPKDRARMVAQAPLLEAYERVQWPRRTARLPALLIYLMDQHGLSRAGMVPLLGTSSRSRLRRHRRASTNSPAEDSCSGWASRTYRWWRTCGSIGMEGPWLPCAATCRPWPSLPIVACRLRHRRRPSSPHSDPRCWSFPPNWPTAPIRTTSRRNTLARRARSSARANCCASSRERFSRPTPRRHARPPVASSPSIWACRTTSTTGGAWVSATTTSPVVDQIDWWTP